MSLAWKRVCTRVLVRGGTFDLKGVVARFGAFFTPLKRWERQRREGRDTRKRDRERMDTVYPFRIHSGKKFTPRGKWPLKFASLSISSLKQSLPHLDRFSRGFLHIIALSAIANSSLQRMARKNYPWLKTRKLRWVNPVDRIPRQVIPVDKWFEILRKNIKNRYVTLQCFPSQIK